MYLAAEFGSAGAAVRRGALFMSTQLGIVYVGIEREGTGDIGDATSEHVVRRVEIGRNPRALSGSANHESGLYGTSYGGKWPGVGVRLVRDGARCARPCCVSGQQ